MRISVWTGVGPGLLALAASALVGMFVAPLLIVSAPLESTMGVVQKIFYFHVPCSILMFLSVFVSAGGSLAYLFKGSEAGDRVALSAAELGTLFGICAMVTGPLWGRKAWGVYWQWDARLTTSFLLLLTLVSYQLARRYGGPAARKLAAALSLFAAVNVPLVYKSVDIWRTIHPKTTVVRTLDPRMRPAFWTSFVTITIVWAALLMLRVRLEAARAAVQRLKVELDDHADVGIR